MKKRLSFIFLLMLNLGFTQQSPELRQLLSQNPVITDQLKPDPSETITLVPCHFAQNDADYTQARKALTHASVLKVYYVYTSYRSQASFDQHQLNKDRIFQFSQQFPEIISDPLVEWVIVEQRGCTSSTAGEQFFHGFVVVHRPALTEENRASEITAILEFMKNPNQPFVESDPDPLDDALKITKANVNSTQSTNTNKENCSAAYPSGAFALYQFFQRQLINTPGIARDRSDLWCKVKFTVDKDGTIGNLTFLDTYSESVTDRVNNAFKKMPAWKPARIQGQDAPVEINLDIRVSYSPSVNGMYLRDGVRPEFKEAELAKPLSPEQEDSVLNAQRLNLESSVIQGLNVLDAQKKYALVMDVTGSMSSYIAAMLTWIHSHPNSQQFSTFRFFNDGDNKETEKKTLGAAGGIYATNRINEVNKTLEKAMRKGSGGPEVTENDIEAVLQANLQDSIATDILLIGDNYSGIRDKALMNQITKPVHVLLCAAPLTIRTEYLELVKNTGGKLLLNGEIIDLTNVIEGETVVIQGFKYVYGGRKFKLEGKEE